MTHDTSADDLDDSASYEEMMQTLEKQIGRLVSAFSELQQENKMLSHRQTNSEKEKTILSTQHHQARKELESLISKLKSME